MKKLIFTVCLAIALGYSAAAFAGTGQHEIVNPNVQGATATASFPSTCYLEADDLTNNKSIYVSCSEFLSTTAADTMAGNLTLDDGTGASPSLTLTDGSDETAVLSKADSGNISVTTLAADGLQVLTGNLFIGNGTPGETINGEDLYVEGISEFDGTANFDGAVDFDGTITIGSTALGSSGDELNTLDVSAGSCGTAVDLSGSNVTTTIQRFGNLCVARFVLAATPVTVTDAAGSGSYGTLKFVDLAEGYVAIHSCSEVYEVLADDGTLAQNNLAGDIGVGSVSLAAAQDGALANATDDNICDETAFDINASAGPYTEITSPVTVIDGSATAADIALNVSGSAATADATGVLTITGQYTITYSMEGDD